MIYSKTIRLEFSNTISDEPSIIALFHEGSCVFAKMLEKLRQESKINFCIMISNHQDGDLMEWVAADFKLHFFRFNSQKINYELKRYLEIIRSSGDRPVLAVDGPVGPYHTIQPGILFLQKQLQLPIQSVFLKSYHFFRINTWDRQIIPFPFTKVKIKFGPLFYAKKQSREEQIKELEKYLHHTNQF